MLNHAFFVPLNRHEILQALNNNAIQLILLQVTESTHLFLKHTAAHSDWVVCIAEQQTKGQGRLTKSWYSPFGENIYFSLRIPFSGSATALAGFSLLLALTVSRVLETYLEKECIQIKWPNDLIVDNKKLAGILVELIQDYIIIGIGINVNMVESPIEQPWISLKKITNHDYNRNTIIGALIQALTEDIPQFLNLGLTPYLTSLYKRDYLMNKVITLQNQTISTTGTALGINPQGYLRLKLQNGQEQLFGAGEVVLFTHFPSSS